MRNGIVMSALDFIKSDDTSDVVFEDAPSVPGENVMLVLPTLRVLPSLMLPSLQLADLLVVC
ncbi:hypothetical protein Hanom_Chr13g01186791 [Helianthus anomalus]